MKIELEHLSVMQGTDGQLVSLQWLVPTGATLDLNRIVYQTTIAFASAVTDKKADLDDLLAETTDPVPTPKPKAKAKRKTTRAKPKSEAAPAPSADVPDADAAKAADADNAGDAVVSSGEAAPRRRRPGSRSTARAATQSDTVDVTPDAGASSDAPAAEPEGITGPQLTAAASKVAAMKGADYVKDMVDQYGVATVEQMTPEQRTEFMDACRAVFV
tara:strand:+ start:351 stop:998 length:648 start_codon:yes stop_codon:yes gene_type:complete